MNAPAAHHLPVTRTARYYTLGSLGEATREVWFVLHGYGQLAGYFIRHFRPLDDGRRVIVAPEALSRFYLEGTAGRIGAAWMTREDRLQEIKDYLGYLDALHERVFSNAAQNHVRVHVLGFSQGAATACRWLTQGRGRADRLILWGGSVPPDVDLSVYGPRFKQLDLTLVIGNRDQYATPEAVAAVRARLEQHAIPYRPVTYEGEHRLDAAVLQRLTRDTLGLNT